MTSPPEQNLSQALHDLADIPGPPSLADAALTGARGLRRRRTALTGLAALAVVGAVATPFLLRPGPPIQAGAPSSTAAPGATAAPAPSGPASTAIPSPQPLGYCADARNHTGDAVNPRKEVDEADWPQFVRTVLGKLPQRSDYVVQNATGVCDPPAETRPEVAQQPNAYAVINVGPARAHGHLTVTLWNRPEQGTQPGAGSQPTTCAALPGWLAARQPAVAGVPAARVLFCADGSAGAPLVFGTQYADTAKTVTAVYPDHRTVSMETHVANPGDTTFTVTAEDLRTVVADPALVNLLAVR